MIPTTLFANGFTELVSVIPPNAPLSPHSKIAATALAHDLTVWTQDNDFAVLAELAPRLRLRLAA